MNDNFFLADSKKKIVITYGWTFRDFKNFEKYSEIIRKFFKPIPLHEKNIELLISKCKNHTDILVGVHIRRGDYKSWREGNYYYGDRIYYDKMLQLNSYFSKFGKRVSFLICSNEKIEKKNFAPLIVNIGTNHFVEDLYSLAKCNYIIGPLSTYSAWASFYGKVPLLYITEPNQQIDIEDFKINCG